MALTSAYTATISFNWQNDVAKQCSHSLKRIPIITSSPYCQKFKQLLQMPSCTKLLIGHTTNWIKWFDKKIGLKQRLMIFM